MPVSIGIDEAGLGPVLGPLCYGMIAFQVSEAKEPSWRELFGQVVAKNKLLFGDSKKIYQGPGKEKKLEKAVGDILSVLSKTPKKIAIRDLYLTTALNESGLWADYPFYQGIMDISLPAPDANKELSEIEVGGWVTACLEGEMNGEFLRGKNKSVVSLQKIGALILHALEIYPREKISFVIDKQGGRHFYLDFLGDLFPFCPVEIIQENSDVSEYFFLLDDREIRISFIKYGDALWEEISMASLLAKWLRETSMLSFNSFWLRYNPVAPTAGYPEDAKRFIEEMMPYFKQSKIGLDKIIRNR